MLVAVKNNAKNPIVLHVARHIILSNFWEYYVTEEPDERGFSFGYVMGDVSEMGDFSIEELKPYILSDSDKISSDPNDGNYILPPEGFSWQ